MAKLCENQVMRNAPIKITCLSLLFVVIVINGCLLFIDTFNPSLLLSFNIIALAGVFILLLITTFLFDKRSLQFERLFNEYPIPMWIYEKATMRFLSVNNAATEKYGYSKKEFLQLTLKDIRNEEDIPLFIENAAEYCNGDEYRGIWKHRKKDGANFFVEIYSLAATYYGKNARFIMAKDVDAQVKAVKEAREIGLRYELQAQLTHDRLVKQASQLEEQNKALKEIAWINSHEIRRPVVSILSIAGLFDKSNQDLHLNTQLMEWLHESTLQLDEIIHKIEHKVKALQ